MTAVDPHMLQLASGIVCLRKVVSERLLNGLNKLEQVSSTAENNLCDASQTNIPLLANCNNGKHTMARDNLRRRQGKKSDPSSARTTEVTTSEQTRESLSDSKKNVSDVIADETRSLTNYLGFVAIVCFFFLHMIQNTPLPPPRRVYGIMIDAGSTGTRAQVFIFHHDQEKNRLILEETKMFPMKKSIASLAAGAAGTGQQFFKPLLDRIRTAIPGVRRRKATPIALRATAGLRLLGPTLAENALSLTRSALNSSEYMFKDEWLSVLSESEEANHAWTTVNYLLGNLDPEKNPEEVDYVGALELGGASMQAVFRHNGDLDSFEDADKQDDTKRERTPYPAMKANIELFGKSHTLHSRSHLGFGLFDFTKKLYMIFDREGVLEEGNPCFRKGKVFENKRLRLGVPGSEKARMVTLKGDGDFDRCVASADIVIASFGRLNDKRSVLPPGSTFYAFAYFYDRTVRLGLSRTPTKEELVAKGRELCETGPDVWVDGDFDEACAEFSYIYAVMKILTDNFSKSGNVKIVFEQFVDQHMLGWALGAVLDTVLPVMHKQLELDDTPLFSV